MKIIINKHPYKAARNEFALPIAYRANPILVRWLELYEYFSSLTITPCKKHQLANIHDVDVIPFTADISNLKTVFANWLKTHFDLRTSDIDIDYLKILEYDEEQYIIHFGFQHDTFCSDCGAENPYTDEDYPCWCCGHRHTAVLGNAYEVIDYIARKNTI